MKREIHNEPYGDLDAVGRYRYRERAKRKAATPFRECKLPGCGMWFLPFPRTDREFHSRYCSSQYANLRKAGNTPESTGEGVASYKKTYKRSNAKKAARRRIEKLGRRCERLGCCTFLKPAQRLFCSPHCTAWTRYRRIGTEGRARERRMALARKSEKFQRHPKIIHKRAGAAFFVAVSRAKRLGTLPAWYAAEEKEIAAIYLFATRHGYDVDHIIPEDPRQEGAPVGLHTVANLQLLRPPENARKNDSVADAMAA